MQKVSEIVITVYATIFYVLTSKFGSLLPFSKMISQNFRVNLLVVQSIIFGFMFYIFFRIGYSILGLKFGHEAFSVCAADSKNSPPPMSKQEIKRGIQQNEDVREMRSRRLTDEAKNRANRAASIRNTHIQGRKDRKRRDNTPRSFVDNYTASRVNLSRVGGLR